MTVASYHGPVGPPPPFPPGLGALAAVLRFVYATGAPHVHDGRTVDDHVRLFGAFLAGQGPPAAITHERRRTRR